MNSNKIDKFNDGQILSLDLTGFESLSSNQQHLVNHLSNAGHYGRDIFYIQNYEHNLIVRNVLELIYSTKEITLASEQLFERFTLYFKAFLFNNGVHDDNHNTLLNVPFEADEYLVLLLALENKIPMSEIELVENILFKKDFVEPYRTYKGDDGDMLSLSAANFHSNVTTEEVKAFQEKNYPKMENAPSFGVNSRIVKSTDPISGESIITEEVASTEGLYAEYLLKMVEELTLALEYAENDKQHKSLSSLIKFYQTGDPADFVEHSIDWVNDTESEIFYINGFIENYTDPMGVSSAFESIVAYKNPVESKRVNTLIDNIQYFEDNLPVDPRFKKTKASAMSASSVMVASFSGQAAPQLPLGIILPNSEWIREKIGSKSVNLANVFQARGISSEETINEFYSPGYIHTILKYGADSALQRINLHEVVGHGLGQLLEGIQNQDLKEYMNLIEETRADSVALYYLLDPKLIEIGLLDESVDIEQYALSHYLDFFNSSAMLQLSRIGADHDVLSQTHMRNRQLIALYVLDKAKESKCIELIKVADKSFIEINDIYAVKEIIGQLIRDIQRIKSEGDYEAAKAICLQYATAIDKDLQKEAIERSSKLGNASWSGFINPIFIKEDNGFSIEQHKTFLADQISLTEKYAL